MYATENQVRDFLRLKGAPTFWIDSAVSAMRPVLASNTRLPIHVVEQKATLGLGGTIKRYSATVAVRYPDRGASGMVKLAYSFNPKRAKAHSATVKPLKETA